MKKQYIECGKIVTIHGLNGEVKVQSYGDVDELCGYDTLYLADGTQSVAVEQARPHKGMALLKLAGVDTPEAAQLLRGRVLYIDRAQDTLTPGQYYIQDLVGLSVTDVDSGERYGELCDVSETGANSVYHIKFADGSIQLIPAIPQVVISVDIDSGEMKIRPLAGLFTGAEEIR